MPGGVPERRRGEIVLGEATQRLIMLIDQAATDPADPLSHLLGEHEP
jgi:ubiquinone biosynthesis protein UbiJ